MSDCFLSFERQTNCKRHVQRLEKCYLVRINLQEPGWPVCIRLHFLVCLTSVPAAPCGCVTVLQHYGL